MRIKQHSKSFPECVLLYIKSLLFVLIPDGRKSGSEKRSTGGREAKSRTVGKECLTVKGLQQGSGQSLYQDQAKHQTDKELESPKGRTCVRKGRWKVKRDGTAIE